MIKILVISTVELGKNGIASVVMNYYRAIEKENMQIDVLAGAGLCSQIREEMEAAGAKVYEIPRKQNVISYMRKLRKLLEEGRYHIIHVHGNSATMAFEMLSAAKAGIPVRIAHSHSTGCQSRLLHRILYPVFEKSYTQGFACGEKAGKWLFQTHPYTVIRNGIDTSRFRFSADLRHEYRKKVGAGNRAVIGHVGYFDTVKNQEFIIELAERMKHMDTKYLFLFIGEGKTMYRMREKADAYGLLNSVLFCGAVSDVFGYLAAMDVFMLPSLYEGFPVSLLEAQCSGLPCLVSDRVSGEVDLTGLVEFLPLEKQEVWIENIQKAICLGDRDETSSRAVRDIAGRGYDISRNADMLKNLYRTYTEGEVYG